jgi:diguanylate cyclase (GGDEF)-like protein
MEPRITPARWARTVLSSVALDAQAIGRPGYSVLLGRCLLFVTGVVVSVPMPLLHLSDGQTFVVVRLTAAMIAVLLISFKVPWGRLPRNAVLAFPISVMTGLASLGHFAGLAIGSCFTGLFVLCFAYIGVCCAGRTVLWILPVALPAYVATVGTWSTNIAIRVVIAASVWSLLAELLAHLTAQQRVVMDALEQASRTDSLTTLGNRRDFDLRLPGLRVGDTVVICDLDHFKNINDTRGHSQGDVILRDFGAVLDGALRGDDYAARYGGEEFVLFLSDTDETQTRDVLARLHRRWAGVHPEVTFSAGYSTRGLVHTPTAVLERADRALYAAKAAGRDRDCDVRELASLPG